MALSSVTITLDLSDKVGDDFDQRRTKAWVTTNVDVVHDTDGNKTRVGSGNGVVAADGVVTWDVWTPGVGANPASWQTTFHVDVPDRNAPGGRKHLAFGPYTITAAANIADLDDEQGVPPVYLTTVTQQLDAKVTEAETAATSAATYAAQARSVADIDTPDALVATLVQDSGSDTGAALSATFGSVHRPERYGAKGDGIADDTNAIRAALTAASSNGSVELSEAIYRITGTLTIPDGCEVRGTSRRGSIIRLTADIPTFTFVGGEGQQIRNLKIHNTFTGNRTTYDILAVNPYHPIFENVEIALSQDSRLKGGIHILHDTAQAEPEKKNMPVLDNVFIRNGVLKIEDVGDVKVNGGWTWGTYTNAPGAVELDRASNFIAINHDVIPSVNAGYYISGGTSNFTIIGGLMDGNGDPSIHPGPAMKVAPSAFVRSLQFVGVKFWNLWKSSLDLYDARAVTITGCEFRANNREDAGHPEIKLAACRDIVAVGNTFSAVDARTNKGLVWSEDAASSNNLLASNSIEATSQYASGVFAVQPSTALRNNMPLDVWPDSAQLAKGADYTINKFDILNGKVILTTAAATITLPSSGSLAAGSAITIKAGATTTIATTSGQTIDGSTATRVLFSGESIRVMADGGNWRTIGQQIAPRLVTPPLSVLTATSAAAWTAANTAAFSRFTLSQPTSLRYANVRVDTSSGNWQVAVVRLSGAGMGDYTRVMDTGVVAMPTAGDKRVDLGASVLPAGEYAIALWCDNTTAQLRHGTNSSVPITRLSAEVGGLAGGIPASGTLAWTASRILGSLSIEAAV